MRLQDVSSFCGLEFRDTYKFRDMNACENLVKMYNFVEKKCALMYNGSNRHLAKNSFEKIASYTPTS